MCSGIMTIDFIMNEFSVDNRKWCCRDLNSKAMVEFNVASPIDTTFSMPIIDVRCMTVKRNYLLIQKEYKDEDVCVVCLISSKNNEDVNKGMTVRNILSILKEFDGDLEVCTVDKNFTRESWVHPIRGICDGTDNNECERYNIQNDYCGLITDFYI